MGSPHVGGETVRERKIFYSMELATPQTILNWNRNLSAFDWEIYNKMESYVRI